MSTDILKPTKSIAQNLCAEKIGLTGKHLIEASAGTGKTFNITRIYLRMLLERKLSVEQILVMTFTKDATQELKGRIDATLREALVHWETLVQTDPFYKAVAEKVSAEEAQFLLKKAVLFLDEAAIFTIHGFCQRVLTEHAFATKMDFDASLETDLSDIVEQATQDCYRVLANQSPADFLLVSEFWPTPHSFISVFSKAIYQKSTLDVLSASHLNEQFVALITLALNSLQDNKTTIFQALIDSQKTVKQSERIAEYNDLIHWLSELKTSPEEAKGKFPTSFYNGTRYSKSPLKSELLEIFQPVKNVKTAYEKFTKSLNKAKAFELVRVAIYDIRNRIQKQKQQAKVLGFDDLVGNLANALSENALLAQRVCEDFPVALVDEFQDTDPDQFTILNALYSTQDVIIDKCESAVFMIGDPKQAIYGFRGGDVFAYLSARERCDNQWLMDTNWRSSIDMIAGYNRLFFGQTLENNQVSDDVFGYSIPYLPVKSSPNAKDELQANDQYKALQFIHFDHELSDKQKVPQSFRPTMAAWCADEISRLLSNVNQLQAQDIAILVRDGTEAKEMKLALSANNLASVYLSNRSDLFETEEAKQLFTLLKGILYCDNDSLFCAAVASPLLCYQAKAYYQLQQDEQAWQSLKFTFENLRKHWLTKSFMSMALKLMHGHFVIKGDDQDRILTNLLHLFELLQIASQRHNQPHELLFWLEQHIQGLSNQSETELRLDSDDDLIKIVTQHGSKGLEYPVVFVPFASRYKNPLKFGNKNVQLIEYHDDDKSLHLSLDGSDKAKEAMTAENHAETIRLLYVAITRAEQRCYILTADFENADKSPIGSTLKLNQASTNENANLYSALKHLSCCQGIGLNHVAYCCDDANDNYHDDIKRINQLTASHETLDQIAKPLAVTFSPAKFTSYIERDWWLSSFSALTRHTSHSGMAAPDRDHDADTALLIEQQSHLMRFKMTKGAQAGNFLHDIFEYLDFSSPNWQEALKRPMAKYQYLLEGFSEQELINWLTEVINTPLNIQQNNTAARQEQESKSINLASLSLQQTLREVEFYFPMADANMAMLANLLSDHRNFNQTKSDQVTNTLFKNQLNKVNLPLYRKLKGMMHGFIDLIFEADGKYYLADYKSSHLGDAFDEYNMQNLQMNMSGNYYDLQYLIYAVALHRYLTLNLKDYDIANHFGGVFYFYLRGMSPQSGIDNSVLNNDLPQHKGVYFTTLPAELLMNLDNLFSCKDNVTDHDGDRTGKGGEK